MLYVFFTQCDECFYSLSGSGTRPCSKNQLQPCPLCILLQLAPYPSDFSLSVMHSSDKALSASQLCLQQSVYFSISAPAKWSSDFEPEARFPSIPYPCAAGLAACTCASSSPCCSLSAFYWNSVSCMYTCIHPLYIIAPHNPSLKMLAVKGPLR